MTDAEYQIRRVAAVMRRNDDRETPLWLDEVGWSSGRYPGFRLAVGKRGQAKRLRQLFNFARANAGRLDIARVFWFALGDPPESLYNCGSCFNFGLLSRHGKPKPSWAAFEKFAAP